MEDMLNQKALMVFVPIFFVLIGAFVLMSLRNEEKITALLQDSAQEGVSRVYFYRNYLRDGFGLEEPLSDHVLLQEFHGILQRMEPARISFKGLEIINTVKIRLEIKTVDEPRLLEIAVHRTEEYRDQAVVSLSEIRGDLVLPGGDFLSNELLSWLMILTEKEAFKEIWI
jgi:hypothetical protein